MNIPLNKETIVFYRDAMEHPENYGGGYPALPDCFEPCEEGTPKHILYERYIHLIHKYLPKVVFYIIMDELYKDEICTCLNEKGENADLGYKLKIRC